jgi:oligoribonuclease NrnB/cAMP/cGMP phosphodiesterase (DHH superfamily)
MKKDLKILNITHGDLDGVVSAIVLCNVFDNVTTVPVSYNDLDNVIFGIGVNNDYDYDSFDVIFTTDINLNKKHINHIKSITSHHIHCDHHQDDDGIHNGKNIIVDHSQCGAAVTKDFVEFNFGAKLDHLDYLVQVTDDYDRWIHNIMWSKPLNYLFEMYGFSEFKEKFMHGFDPKKITQPEATYLTKVNDATNEFWKSVKKTMILSDESRVAVIYATTKYINDMADKVLRSKEYDVDMVYAINLKNFKCSVRTHLDDFNAGIFFTRLDVGGGHPKAASFTNKQIKTDPTLEDETKNDLILMDIEKYDAIIQQIYPKIKR